MGFLRKIVKKVKKGVKKVARGIKKVVKKISKSKILKTIALVGAAIVTGGAAIGAFGGQLASSTMGTWLTTASSKILATPVIGTLAKPFQMLGTAVGTGAGKVTDFLGVTTEAGRQYVPGVSESVGAADVGKVFDAKTGVEIPLEQLGTKTVEELTEEAATQATGNFARGTIAGDVARGVGTGVLTGAAMQYIQGDPEAVGALGAGLGEERGIEMNPLDRSYVQAGIDYRDIYSQLTFGTADPGFLASRYPDLYQQQTLSLGGA